MRRIAFIVLSLLTFSNAMECDHDREESFVCKFLDSEVLVRVQTFEEFQQADSRHWNSFRITEGVAGYAQSIALNSSNGSTSQDAYVSLKVNNENSTKQIQALVDWFNQNQTKPKRVVLFVNHPLSTEFTKLLLNEAAVLNAWKLDKTEIFTIYGDQNTIETSAKALIIKGVKPSVKMDKGDLEVHWLNAHDGTFEILIKNKTKPKREKANSSSRKDTKKSSQKLSRRDSTMLPRSASTNLVRTSTESLKRSESTKNIEEISKKEYSISFYWQYPVDYSVEFISETVNTVIGWIVSNPENEPSKVIFVIDEKIYFEKEYEIIFGNLKTVSFKTIFDEQLAMARKDLEATKIGRISLFSVFAKFENARIAAKMYFKIDKGKHPVMGITAPGSSIESTFNYNLESNAFSAEFQNFLEKLKFKDQNVVLAVSCSQMLQFGDKELVKKIVDSFKIYLLFNISTAKTAPFEKIIFVTEDLELKKEIDVTLQSQ